MYNPQYDLLKSRLTIRKEINALYRANEEDLIKNLVKQLELTEDQNITIKKLATKLVTNVRKKRTKSSGVDALMLEFNLSSQEGIALMCLAESLLRIPDIETSDALIIDKIADGDWKSHLWNSKSLFVNASAWGLNITSKVLKLDPSNNKKDESSLFNSLKTAIIKGGKPVIRKSMDIAMKMLGKQFVTGETIEQAIKNGNDRFNKGYRYSYDMLGEAAITQEDANKYYNDYVHAINVVGKSSNNLGVIKSSGISVKLSAIHPRYNLSQHKRVIDELYPRLLELFELAKKYNIGLNIDAEETERLELSLDLIEKLIKDPKLKGFDGIGIVVQAYQKRCPEVIKYLISISRENKCKIMVRLVKGAYWDSEIKKAQSEGATDYPVYTKKVHTDISYIACAKILLEAQDCIYPQFATHNAQSLATIYTLAKGKIFEFQCLHGMGETLYDQVVGPANLHEQVRIYAPVGSYKTLLAYLVRRLLENGANSSFVNQIMDENISIDDLVRSPLEILENNKHKQNILVKPTDIYKKRQNSKGFDFNDITNLIKLENSLNELQNNCNLKANSLLSNNKHDINGEVTKVINPSNNIQIGEVIFGTEKDVITALENAENYKNIYANTSLEERANILYKTADLFEENYDTFFDLAIREAGKSAINSLNEVREAVDFLRYYADQILLQPEQYHTPRGIAVAISPWNFPLAIFTGQIAAALATGNVVIAKPAEQTSLIAYYATKLFYKAGLNPNALQLVLGLGEIVGNKLTNNDKVDIIIFTGSTEVARLLQININKQEKEIILIAETGGQNALIVDSSALPEQVVSDVISSAFDSAGQRCSALRILYLQEEIAPEIIKMIKGTMKELKVGNPMNFSTDIGPVIDQEAKQNLENHIKYMSNRAKSTFRLEDNEETLKGSFVQPTLFEIDDINLLTKEVFGPVLHVITYKAADFNKVIEEINSTGYGLTCGLHSRIDKKANEFINSVHAGNIYINRNQIGAIVGVQPFGGMGLSGTGPKAGGPIYLQRLSKAKLWKINGNKQINEELIFNKQKINELVYKIFGNQAENILTRINELYKNKYLNTKINLQSITGEDNYIIFTPRGHIAIGEGSLEDQFICYISLLITNNQSYILNSSPLAKYKEIIDANFVDDFTSNNKLSTYIVLNKLSTNNKLKLANKEGPLWFFIDGLDLVCSLLPLLHEKSISINTAAAGGNTTLMSSISI